MTNALAQRLPNWPIRSPGLFMGWTGDCFIVLMSSEITPAETNVYYRELDLSLKARGDDHFGFVVASGEAQGAGQMDSLKRHAEFLKARADVLRRTTSGFAMITESFLARIATRTILTLAPPPCPYAIVPTARAAFEYVAKQGVAVDVATAVRLIQSEGNAIKLTVP